MPSSPSSLALDQASRAQRSAIAARCAAVKRAFAADAALLATLPEARDRQRARAEAAAAGMLVLPGTGGAPRFVGAPPDWWWHPPGEPGYLHTLNRLPHWNALLGERLVSGERRWADAVVGELRDWLARCPAPDLGDPAAMDALCSGYGSGRAASPWHLLDVGIRAFGPWRLALIVLADDPALDDATFAAWHASLSAHAETLLATTPRLWPRFDHNHALMESLGLLTIGCLLREHPRAEAWRLAAAERLDACARAQITADGGQIEGCPGYHHGCVSWFAQAALTAREHGVELGDEFARRLRGAAAYSLHCTRPDGDAVPWGDSRPEPSGMPAALWSWLACGDDAAVARAAALAGPRAAEQACEALLWRTPGFARARERVATASPATAAPTLLWDRELKQVALRTGWSRDAASVFFACRAPVGNGHAHVDPMGFDFCALGAPLVPDPSYFTYRDGEDRRRFKSPESHATVTVDGRWPFAMRGSWTFGDQPTGAIRGAGRVAGAAFASARLDWLGGGTHDRLLLLLDGGELLVVDRLVGFAPDAVASAWFPLAAASATWDVAHGRAIAGGSPGLVVATSRGAGAILPLGIATDTDVEHAGCKLRLDVPLAAREATAWATLLAPFAAAAPPARVACAVAGGGSAGTIALPGRALRWRWDGETTIALADAAG